MSLPLRIMAQRGALILYVRGDATDGQTVTSLQPRAGNPRVLSRTGIIVYGLLTEQSIGKLFVAGIIPAFIVKGIAGDVPLETVFKGIVPFLIALIVGTAIMIAFPTPVTWLPDLMY